MPHALSTLGRALAGLVLAVAVGTPLGLAMGSSPALQKMLVLPVDGLRSVPATALFPLFMILLGIGTPANVALVAFPCVWIMTINSMYGVQSSSRARREMAEILGLKGMRGFTWVTFPDALPYIATGFRLCLATALHMAIIAEMFTGSARGLGRRIFDAQLLFQIPEMYALIILVGLLGYGANLGWQSIERRLVHWAGR